MGLVIVGVDDCGVFAFCNGLATGMEGLLYGAQPLVTTSGLTFDTGISQALRILIFISPMGYLQHVRNATAMPAIIAWLIAHFGFNATAARAKGKAGRAY